MFVAAVHVFVKPDAIDAFMDLIRADQEGTLAEPGCVRFDVVRSVEDPHEFLIWEVYLDEDAAAFHKTTPHYLEFKEKMPALASRDRYADRYEGVSVPSDKVGR
jgi:autoinducer 2-degrading protein